MDSPKFLTSADILFCLPDGARMMESPSAGRELSQSSSGNGHDSSLGFLRSNNLNISRDKLITFVLMRIISNAIFPLQLDDSRYEHVARKNEEGNDDENHEHDAVIESALQFSCQENSQGKGLEINPHLFFRRGVNLESILEETESMSISFSNTNFSPPRPLAHLLPPKTLDTLRVWAANIALSFDGADTHARGEIKWHTYIAHLMGLIEIQNNEDRRKLLVEFTQETRGGVADEEEVIRAVQNHFSGEGKTINRKEEIAIANETSGAPLVLAERTAAEGIISLQIEYIYPLLLWSILQVNATSRGRCNASNHGGAENSQWTIIDDAPITDPESDGKPTIAIQHIFEEHGVCICHYIEPINQFIIFSRRQTVYSYLFKNSYAPATTDGKLQQRCSVEKKRPSAHFPFDVVSSLYCAQTQTLIVGTLDGSVVGMPVLSTAEGHAWATPTFIIRGCADDSIVSMASMPKLNRILCCSFGSRICVADRKRETVADGYIAIPPRLQGIRQILVLEDLHLIATCGHGNEIALWSVSFPTSKPPTQKSSNAPSRSQFVGGLSDPISPHVPPLLTIWRGKPSFKEGGVVDEKLRNKLLSVDSVGTVKIWDLTSRSCVSTCSQPSLFKAFSAAFASITLKNTSADKIRDAAQRAQKMRRDFLRKLRGGRNAHEIVDEPEEPFDTIKVRICGVDVSRHRAETREVVITLGDDYLEAPDRAKTQGSASDNLLPKGNKPVITDSMKRGKHLVTTGHSLVTKTINRLLTNPYHIGTFDVECMGCIVSVTNDFIVVLERNTHRVISRYSGFGSPFTAACVAPEHVWRYSRVLFAALERSSSVLVINLGNGDVTLTLQLHNVQKQGTVDSRRDFVSLVAIPQRCMIVAANGEGFIAVFKLPIDDKVTPTSHQRVGKTSGDCIRPIHFLKCSDTFITRMAYHSTAEILAIGDGKGRLYQWDITPNTNAIGLCNRIIQSHAGCGGGDSSQAVTLGTGNVTVNALTDKQLHDMALDETVMEITAITALDPLRAFAVATSDAKITLWTTIPFDKAVSVISWEYSIPRGIPLGRWSKPVVIAIAHDNTSLLHTLRVVDDQGGWSLWNLGHSLRDSQLLVNRNVEMGGKWSTDDLSPSTRHPTLLAHKQLTCDANVPLVGIQQISHRGRGNRGVLNSLVSVSNGDSLIVGPSGEFIKIIQPMTRRDKKTHGSRSVGEQQAPASLKDLYNLSDDFVQVVDELENDENASRSRGKEKWSFLKEQCAGSEKDIFLKLSQKQLAVDAVGSEVNAADPVLYRPQRAPPPSPTRYRSILPKMRVASASKRSTNVSMHVKLNRLVAPEPSNSFKITNEIDPTELMRKLQCLAELPFDIRLKERAPPTLYAANVTLALGTPLAYTLAGKGVNEEEDDIIIDGSDGIDRSHIVEVLNDANSVEFTKPLLLENGDFVVFNRTEKLHVFNSVWAVGNLKDEPVVLPTASEEETAVDISRDGGSSETMNTTLENCDETDKTSSLKYETSDSRRSQLQSSSVASRASCLGDQHAHSVPLARLLALSSPSYPLAPSAYLSQRTPPSLNPFLFGVPETPLENTEGVNTKTTNELSPSFRMRPSSGNIIRVASPITRDSRPSSPSIPSKKYSTSSIQPLRSKPLGVLRNPPKSHLIIASEKSRSQVNFHLGPHERK